MRASIALSIFFILTVVTGSAAAQRVVVPPPLGEPSADSLSTARERFAEGTTAAEEGRWSDALSAFRQAYELSGISAALYNVGTTYRSLGRYVDARDTFAQLLREHPDLSGDMKGTVTELRDEVAARVAAIELQGVPLEGELNLRFDGRRTEVPEERPVRLETEGGRHAVRLTQPDHEPFTWEGTVAEGDTRVVEVELIPITADAAPPQGMSTAGKAILITVIGLVLVGAGVGVGLALREDGLQPESGLVVRL